MLDPNSSSSLSNTKQVLHRDVGMSSSLTPTVQATRTLAEWKEILPPLTGLELLNSLQSNQMIEVVNPSEEEIQYALTEFKRLNLVDVNSLNYEKVSSIGKKQLTTLNTRLKEFTTKMTGFQTPGLFGLIDDLSKDLKEADFPAVWQKAVNAKPTMWARFCNIFNSTSARNSLNNHFNSLSTLVQERGNTLEAKLTSIEKQLIVQRNEQLLNIKTLETSFELYLQTFIDLRKEFLIVCMLEHYYTSYVHQLGEETQKNTDLILNNEFDASKEILRDIGDKRMLMHKSLLQLPITAQQSKNLVVVCKNLLKEIDNTVYHGFPIIRTNLTGLAVGLRTQQAILTNRSAQDLEQNTSMLAAEVAGDLAVKGELLSSESRLREAEGVAALIEKVIEVERRLSEARVQSANNLEEAKSSLLKTTAIVKEVLGNSNE